jgi:hypothetical protein
MMAMVLSRRLGHGAMSLPSHVWDDPAEVIWLWCNICVESCWWWRCRGAWLWHDVDAMSCWWWHCWGDLVVAQRLCHVMLAMALSRCLSHSAMSLPSHAGDGTTEMTWPWCVVALKSCWQWCCRGVLAMLRCCCRVMLAMALPRRLGHGVMSLPSHAGDDPAEAFKPWCDVGAMSCWRCHNNSRLYYML